MEARPPAYPLKIIAGVKLFGDKGLCRRRSPAIEVTTGDKRREERKEEPLRARDGGKGRKRAIEMDM